MLKTMLEKVGIVGAGMTGATVASLLRHDLNKTASLTVIDKSRGVGGRMATSRSNKDSNTTVDLGAQYLSATPDYQQKHASFYEELLSANVIQPLQGLIDGHKDKEEGIKHYVAPGGSSTIVKYFLNKADPEIKTDQLVTAISLESDKVKVTTDKGSSVLYDGLVLTMPVPQILQLQGDISKLIDEQNIRGHLEAVSYSSRFAVGLFLPPGSMPDVPWVAKYVTNNPCIRYVSIDNKKRGIETVSGPSVCIHTGAPWGIDNLETDKDTAAVEILQHLTSLGIPGLTEPLQVKGHKWRYSQVNKPYVGSPGCVVLNTSPAVILAGDAFCHSNIDGCIESALSVQRVVQSLTTSNV